MHVQIDSIKARVKMKMPPWGANKWKIVTQWTDMAGCAAHKVCQLIVTLVILHAAPLFTAPPPVPRCCHCSSGRRKFSSCRWKVPRATPEPAGGDAAERCSWRWRLPHDLAAPRIMMHTWGVYFWKTMIHTINSVVQWSVFPSSWQLPGVCFSCKWLTRFT